MEHDIICVVVLFVVVLVVNKVVIVLNVLVRIQIIDRIVSIINKLILYSGTWKTKMWYCQCDNKDGCNGSTHVRISSITVLFGIITYLKWQSIFHT